MTDIEEILNSALRDVALEIRSVDAISLACDMHRMAFANLGDIVHSALELYFKPDALIFAYAGEVKLTWFTGPSIGLDLELHAAGVDAFFRLVIEGLSMHVRIQHMSVDGAPFTCKLHISRIHRAIDAARAPARGKLAALA
jgi:hypothetical protein